MPKFTVTRLSPEEAQAVWQSQSRLDPEFEDVYMPMLNESNVGDTLNIDMTAEGVEWMTADQVRDIIYNLNEAARRRTRKVSLTLSALTPEQTAALQEAKASKQPFVLTTVDGDDVETTRSYENVGGNKWVATIPDPVVLRYKKSFREGKGIAKDKDGKDVEVKKLEYSKIQFRLAGLAEIKHRAKRAKSDDETPAQPEHTNGTADHADVPAPFENVGAPAA